MPLIAARSRLSLPERRPQSLPGNPDDDDRIRLPVWEVSCRAILADDSAFTTTRSRSIGPFCNP
jgi:hypothetical protein